jgi:hypothetical protein
MGKSRFCLRLAGIRHGGVRRSRLVVGMRRGLVMVPERHADAGARRRQALERHGDQRSENDQQASQFL